MNRIASRSVPVPTRLGKSVTHNVLRTTRNSLASLRHLCEQYRRSFSACPNQTQLLSHVPAGDRGAGLTQARRSTGKADASTAVDARGADASTTVDAATQFDRNRLRALGLLSVTEEVQASDGGSSTEW